MFEADLGFDKNDNLSMIPNRNKFLNDIMFQEYKNRLWSKYDLVFIKGNRIFE